MMQVACERGYEGAGVSHVLDASGASRSTFYRHFSGREECFRAAYRQAAAALRARLALAACAAPPSQLPTVLLSLLLEAAGEHPVCARFFLVESLGGPRSVRREHEGVLETCALWIEEQLRRPGVPPLQAPPRGLLGGVIGAVSHCLVAGEAHSLLALHTPLLAWVNSYGLPSRRFLPGAQDWQALGSHLRPPPPAPQPAGLLPRGRGSAPVERVTASHRERILAATAHQVAAHGYSNITVADIVSSARVSRRAFYRGFRGKRDAFLAAQADSLRGSIAAAAARFSLERSWSEAVWSASEAMLSYVASHPAQAELGLNEIYAAGEPAVRLHLESRAAYALFLEPAYRDLARAVDREVWTNAIAGAIYALMSHRAHGPGPAEMRAILPQAAYLILAPFLGPPAALEFVVARAPAVR